MANKLWLNMFVSIAYQIKFNLTCVLRDIRNRKWNQIIFHAKGVIRAVKQIHFK